MRLEIQLVDAPLTNFPVKFPSSECCGKCPKGTGEKWPSCMVSKEISNSSSLDMSLTRIVPEVFEGTLLPRPNRK